MVDFNNAISITDNFVPILLSFYIGSWSDKFGRKPFIALFMLGKLVALLGTLLGGVFLEEMGKWAWLGLVTPINCLAGGVSTFVLVTYSFAADNSSPRDRFLKLAVLGYMWDISFFIATPIGAELFSYGGYILVFSTGLGVYTLACLVGLWRLWGYEEKINKTELSIPDLVSPKNFTDSLKATFRKRPGHKNIYILSMILIIFIMDMASQGDWIIEMMYLKKIFQWGVVEFSYYDTFFKAVCNVGSILSLPIFHYLNRNDNEVILISVLSCILQKFFKALVRTEAKYYAATLLGLLINVYYAPVRVQVSRCVPPEELGKVYATMSSFSALSPIVATAIYTNVYNATSDLSYPWSATYLFTSAGFFVIGGLITLCVYVSLGFKQILSEEEEQQMKKQEPLS